MRVELRYANYQETTDLYGVGSSVLRREALCEVRGRKKLPSSARFALTHQPGVREPEQVEARRVVGDATAALVVGDGVALAGVAERVCEERAGLRACPLIAPIRCIVRKLFRIIRSLRSRGERLSNNR